MTMLKNLNQLRRHLPFVLEDAENGLPDRSRQLLCELWEDLIRLGERLKAINAELDTYARTAPQTQLLLALPGIGPVVATALVSVIGDASAFRKGRDPAAWLGLVPRQYSTGGQTRLLGIGKRGNRHLRMLFIQGACAVLRAISKRQENDGLRHWVERVTARKHPNVVAVALTNKMARIVHGVLRHKTPSEARLMSA